MAEKGKKSETKGSTHRRTHREEDVEAHRTHRGAEKRTHRGKK
jgi:hypothetical protein